jgi:hypothetical protein
MKSRVIFVLAASVSFATGLIVGESRKSLNLPVMETAQATDGAFRDGLYLGKLDAEQGRKQHPAIGRWNTTEARASFFAGYRQGYRPSSELTSGRITGPSVAELAAAGYRDGLLDGAWHRAASKPFQAEQSSSYRAAGAVYLGTAAELEAYTHFYREGYMKGYQRAYSPHPELQLEKAIQ